MDRRGFLRALTGGVAILAGCSQAPSSSTTTVSEPSGLETTTDSSDESKQSDGLQRRVTLAGQDSVPPKFDISLSAQMSNTEVTAAHPATVQLMMANDGSKRRISVGQTSKCGLFARNGASKPAGLYLHRPSKSKRLPQDGERWTQQKPASKQRTVLGYGCGYPVYATGESETNTYWIWDDYRTQGYMPPETYRFETDVEVWKTATTAVDTDTPKETFTWGFSVTVKPATD